VLLPFGHLRCVEHRPQLGQPRRELFPLDDEDIPILEQRGIRALRGDRRRGTTKETLCSAEKE
jgi:hypothetical protein